MMKSLIVFLTLFSQPLFAKTVTCGEITVIGNQVVCDTPFLLSSTNDFYLIKGDKASASDLQFMDAVCAKVGIGSGVSGSEATLGVINSAATLKNAVAVFKGLAQIDVLGNIVSLNPLQAGDTPVIKIICNNYPAPQYQVVPPRPGIGF